MRTNRTGLNARKLSINELADGEGFEPSVPFGTHAFQACTIDHSVTHPVARPTIYREISIVKLGAWTSTSAAATFQDLNFLPQFRNVAFGQHPAEIYVWINQAIAAEN